MQWKPSVGTHGAGSESEDEFIGIMASRMLKRDTDGELEQAFGIFDDGDGTVHLDRVRAIMQTMGSQPLPKADVDSLMSLLSPDANGCVTMDDFRNLPCWDVPLPNMGAASDAASSKRVRSKHQ